MAFVEGYLDRISVLPGEFIRMHASTDLPDPCSVTIVREGSEEVMWRCEALDVGCYPNPPVEAEAWRTGPGWPAIWEFKVPLKWQSGVYRIDLTASQSKPLGMLTQRSYVEARHPILFVVRAAQPASRSKILLQLGTNTYWAYNNWGGKSVYSYNSWDKKQATHVTLQRPGMGYMGGTNFTVWERQFVLWAHKEGIELEFATNYDLHTWPQGFDDYRLILSVGHDEYWSSGMRDHLEAFVERGGNAAFFSGNTMCWQVRFEDEGNTMVTYKEFYRDDPAFKQGNHRLISTLWSHPLVGRPENQLTGVGSPMGGFHRSHGIYMDGSGAYTIKRDDHWVLEGTGLKKGDSFGGEQTIVGYECDGCEFVMKNGYPVPTGRDGTPENFVILAQAPAYWGRHNCAHAVSYETRGVDSGQATLGLYTTSGGGTVFTAGTTDWAHGLGKNKAVDQITRNILRRLGAAGEGGGGKIGALRRRRGGPVVRREGRLSRG